MTMSRSACCVAGLSCLAFIVLIGCLLATYQILKLASPDNWRLNGTDLSSPGCVQNAEYPDLDSWVPPEDIRSACIYFLSGFDNCSRPVWIVDYGSWNLANLLEEGYEQDMRKYLHQIVYNIRCSFGMRNATNRQWVLISDLGENSSLLDALAIKDFAIAMAQEFEPFSRTLAYGYVFNVHWFVEGYVWPWLQGYLGPVLNRLALIETESPADKWLPKLRTNISIEQLPEEYGGLPDHMPSRSFEEIMTTIMKAHEIKSAPAKLSVHTTQD